MKPILTCTMVSSVDARNNLFPESLRKFHSETKISNQNMKVESCVDESESYNVKAKNCTFAHLCVFTFQKPSERLQKAVHLFQVTLYFKKAVDEVKDRKC